MPESYKFIKKETLTRVFSCKFREISKNTFSYRIPLDDCFYKCTFIFHCLLFHLVLIVFSVIYITVLYFGAGVNPN